jgi:hypothetical protein
MQYDSTLGIAVEAKQEIKAKFRDRLQILFSLSSAKPDTPTYANDLQCQDLPLARGISKLKDLEGRLDKNVFKVKGFQHLVKQIHDETLLDKEKVDKGASEEEFVKRTMESIQKADESHAVCYDLSQTFKKVGEMGSPTVSSVTSADAPLF